MEFSGDVYGNVNDGDPSHRCLDEDENIYANQETIRTQMSTQKKKENVEISGPKTTTMKYYRVSVVSLGLLCVLLLAVIIWMVTKHTAETDQLQRHMDLLQLTNNNLTQERDQLQLSNSKLTEERELFQQRNTNLTKERDQLTVANTKLENTVRIAQGWRRFDDSFYYISNDQTTWSDAKQQCMDRGGYLTIIDSEEEQVFISGFQKRGWIGLTDVEGTWKWLDGKLLKTGYWKEGEPNSFNGNEHCVEILHDATPLKNWNDNTCTEKYHYFCERPLCYQ